MSNKIELLEAARKRYEMMPHLKLACTNCKMCELGWRSATRGNDVHDPHVFSNYDPIVDPAQFMIVGQNPGWNELKAQTPFVGLAGKNFDTELDKTFWKRSDFYISNAVKCYTEGNKPPQQRNLAACEPFLRMEIAIIKPRLVVAFGAVAFSVLCDTKFSDNIGKITTSEKFGVKVFTTYHPSPLNLQDVAKKKQFAHDVAMIAKMLNYYLTPF